MGFTYEEFVQLRRIEITLQRWGEAEANGEIQRDDRDGKPYRQFGRGNGPFKTVGICDREAGALRRLERIMARHPLLVAYHQGDCRGCNLYILHKPDVRAGEEIGSIYNRGLAVCC